MHKIFLIDTHFYNYIDEVDLHIADNSKSKVKSKTVFSEVRNFAVLPSLSGLYEEKKNGIISIRK